MWPGGACGAWGRIVARFPRLYLSGCGGQNPVLVRMLRELVRPMVVLPFDDLEIPSRAREAVSFAVLANECLARRACNLPRVTGARRRAALGELAWGADAHGR
jgi:anhydro-N-acetylmuramic acid kinase